MKISLINLGCPKNHKDGEQYLSEFLLNGFEYVKDTKKADLLVINTCSFINDAKEESIQEIIKAVNIRDELRLEGKKQILAVVGCLPQIHAEELKTEIPEVDIIFGVGKFNDIYKAYLELKEIEPSKTKKNTKDYYSVLRSSSYLPETFLYSDYIKISEGCNNRCTYCSIPTIRGGYKPRDEKELISELSLLVSNGVKEVILVAQDLTEDPGRLKSLLKSIGKLPSSQRPKWLRLMYCNPWGVDRELIRMISNEDWILNYIDMPIQHISDKILKKMGRKSDSKLIQSKIEDLVREGIVVRSTVLVGFPGEDDNDFHKLKSFISQGYFHWLGIFIFSPQDGTEAGSMKGRVSRRLSLERRNELDRIQFEVTTGFNNNYVGRTLPVLISSPPIGGFTEGRIYSQAPLVDGIVKIDSELKGPFENVLIKDVHAYDLTGSLN